VWLSRRLLGPGWMSASRHCSTRPSSETNRALAAKPASAEVTSSSRVERSGTSLQVLRELLWVPLAISLPPLGERDGPAPRFSGCASKLDPGPRARLSARHGLALGQEGRDAAEAALAALEFGDGVLEIMFVEVGPHAIGEEQLGVGALPEQEVREALLAA